MLDSNIGNNTISDFHQMMILMLINTKLSDYGVNVDRLFTNIMLTKIKMWDGIEDFDTNEVSEFIDSNKKNFTFPKLWLYWNENKLSLLGPYGTIVVECDEDEYGQNIPKFKPNPSHGFSKYMEQMINLHNEPKFRKELMKIDISKVGKHPEDMIDNPETPVEPEKTPDKSSWWRFWRR